MFTTTRSRCASCFQGAGGTCRAGTNGSSSSAYAFTSAGTGGNEAASSLVKT
jgi:hypothetical protein